MTETARSPHWEEVTGALEVWERDGDSQFFGVTASLNDYPEWPWTVEVAVTEFLREDPLQTEFFRAMTRALRSVNGVVKAAHEDREVWLISGAPFLAGKRLHWWQRRDRESADFGSAVSGSDLVAAAASVIDTFEPRLRSHFAAIKLDLH